MGVFVIGLSGTGWQACPPPHNSRSDGICAGRRRAGASGTTSTRPPDLGAHEPVRWRLGRIEQRVAGPHVINVIDSDVRMLEQVRGLGVDLKRVFLIQQV